MAPLVRTRSAMRKSRAIWIVNHKTLLHAEVPILRSLGYEVFVPKIVPTKFYRSGVVDRSYDADLTCSPTALRVLNDHPFYTRPWSPALQDIINEHFQVLITSMSIYGTPFIEALGKFEG